MYRRNVKQNFKSFASALVAIPVSKAPRRPRICLFILLLILFCAFFVSPVRAQQGRQSIIFADDFESDPSSRWTISRELTDPNTFVPRDWTWVHTLPETFPGSGPRPGSAFFAPDPAAPELCSAPFPGQFGVLLLESPPITVSRYIEGLFLSFDHWVSLEDGFDGGQLMISVNGGPYVLVAYESFLQHGYNNYIYSIENPRFGQAAWSGDRPWHTVIVDLSGYARSGDTIRLRWDMSTDYCFGTDAGWYVDDVRVYSGFAGDPPANKDECKNGGWAEFTYPKRFRSQGECISFVESNPTIVVHSTADDGPGSLRQALHLAHDGDMINVRARGTITLTSGELVVNKSVTIRGAGADKLSVSGNNASRVLRIMPGKTVTLSGIKITNGNFPFEPGGAGIFNDQANLTIEHCTISGNNAGPYPGGGIYNTGRVELINSAITDNSRHGIESLGQMSITRSEISRNLDGGISNSGVLSVTNSQIRENHSAGIFNNGYIAPVTVTLTNIIVSDNGTGIVSRDTAVTLNNSTVKNNSGGGIDNFGFTRTATFAIVNSTVSNNTIPDPVFVVCGGITNVSAGDGSAFLKLINSTVSSNSGKGICSVADRGIANLTVINSTISGHSEVGIFNQGLWGGTSVARISNSTVTNNAAGGILNYGIFENSSMTLEIANTIVTAGGLGPSIDSVVFESANATVISLGYNLSDDAAGGDGETGPGGLLNGPGDIRNTNPLLGPLQNNGGPTTTHALLANSPAINAGDLSFNPNAFDPPLLYDQRNSRRFPRVVNGRIDIGAFEFRS